MVLLHNVFLCNVRKKDGKKERRQKCGIKTGSSLKLLVKQSPPPPQKKKNKNKSEERPSQGGFSITHFSPQANLEKWPGSEV